MDRRQFLFTTMATMAVGSASGSSADEMPFRQIHLDFHTNERIPDIGADFKPAEFLETLREARVNSINVFAKCHHGLAYYQTELATMHPALRFDLLGEMVNALKPAGIKVNYYYSLVWDVLQSRRHPEWLMLERDGKPIGGQPTDKWPWLCMNTPYFEQVVRENEEILSKYKVDGSWFDILKQPPDGCFCKWCIADRKKLGLGDSADDIFKHNKLVALRVEDRLQKLTLRYIPNGLTFFNSRLVIGVRDELPFYSHIEIESLPTGGWGYSHFQQRVRYMRTLGKDVIGMTGRFHKSWGDFGGLKNQAALDYECLNFIANGTKVCVGDQLHPRGKLDPVTYSRIGNTYRKIEALEPWARGAKAVADIGVVSAAATNPERTTQKIPTADQGFTNMLIELHHQFDVLDADSPLDSYKVVILPDEIRPADGLLKSLEEYIARGGAVIASGESLLDPKRMQFATKSLGVKYEGRSRFEQEYMLLKPEAFPSIDNQPYFLYQRGTMVIPEPGTEVLATYGHPYFDRSPEQFSSHKQTPMGKASDDALITRKGKVVYIANPFFTSYALDGFGVQKLVTRHLLKGLLPKPLVKANLPSTAQVTVLAQGSRRVLHVLYYPLTRRAPDIDIIEEPGVLVDTTLALRADRKPSRVMLLPEQKPLEFRYEYGYAHWRLPLIVGHQAVAVEWA